MGEAAARDVAEHLRAVLAEARTARMMFAAAPSQAEVLAALVAEPDIDWSRVTAFHLDEYLGLAADAPERFGTWLRNALFDRLPFQAVHCIDPDRGAAAAVSDYAALISAAPIDIVCLGIGVNGHLAFNDPPVARFDDEQFVKIVELDETCRQQQVADGCFPTLGDVPESAITVTIPAIMNARRLICVVPGRLKAEALRATVIDPINTACPSTVLRTHPACSIYADAEAASLLALTPAAPGRA
jgi:glucosamine-6-phosphate deaminase